MASVVINFSDLETAKQFARWFDSAVEQSYFDYQNYIGSQHTVAYFKYNYRAMEEESTNEEILIEGIKDVG
jgi:hypothetical protein